VTEKNEQEAAMEIRSHDAWGVGVFDTSSGSGIDDVCL